MELSTALPQSPNAVRDLLSDEREIEAFKHWKSYVGNEIHPAFGKEREFDNQRAVWRAPITR